MPAVALSPTERERVRERGELGGRCAADVDEAGALGGDALVGQRPSRAREEALHIGGSEVRPRLGQQRGRARHHGGGRARAVHGPVARGAVVVAPGLRGREHDSRSGHVRLHARVEGEATRRERRDLRGRAVARGARDADRDDRVAVLGERIRGDPAYAVRDAQHRNVDRLVEPEPAGGQLRPVDNDGARTGRDGVVDRQPRVASGLDERGLAGDEADTLAVEEARELGRRRRWPRLRELELQGLRRHDRTGERHPLVEQEPEPGADDDRGLLRLGAQVGGADRQRRGSAARARDAAVAGAGGPVVPDRRDDERVEPQRALDRLRLGRVGKGRVRGCEPDHRDPGRIVCIAVEVRVDGALEPGDHLVRSPVDCPAAGQVALPAGHADRQDRGAGRNPRDPTRAARARRAARPSRSRAARAGSRRRDRRRPGRRCSCRRRG